MDQADLPLPGYDQLPVGSVEHRVRSLDTEGVQKLLDYERENADRAAVVTVLESRLEQLRSGAEPSGGSPTAEQPEQPSTPTHEPPASPETEGPPINPPPQGDPTNPPAQPRR